MAAYGLGLVVTVFALVLDEWTYRGYGGLRERLLLASRSAPKAPAQR